MILFRALSRMLLILVGSVVRLLVKGIQLFDGKGKGTQTLSSSDRNKYWEEWEVGPDQSVQPDEEWRQIVGSLARPFAKTAPAEGDAGKRKRKKLIFLIAGAAFLALVIGVIISWSSAHSVQAASDQDGPGMIKEISELINQKQYARAKQRVSQLRKLPDFEASSYQLEGQLYGAQDDYGSARSSFAKAVELAPNAKSALFNLATTELYVGNYGEAAKFFRQAESGPPYSAILTYRLYLSLSKQGEVKDAETLLKRSPLPPQSPGWYYVQAANAFLAGDKREGMRIAEAARTLYPDRARSFEDTLRQIGLMP